MHFTSINSFSASQQCGEAGVLLSYFTDEETRHKQRSSPRLHSSRAGTGVQNGGHLDLHGHTVFSDIWASTRRTEAALLIIFKGRGRVGRFGLVYPSPQFLEGSVLNIWKGREEAGLAYDFLG